MSTENPGDFTQQFNAGIPAIPQSLQTTTAGGKPNKSNGWKILWAIITAISVMANGLFFLLLIGMAFFVAAGSEKKVSEEVITKGPHAAKIAIISIDGIIDQRQVKDFQWQMKTARSDNAIKGLIIRINSPGGTISGSDEIYNEIKKYRSEKGKPVVAFMQGVAASGGYYSSVACEQIIAEPTTITGSIGVISAYLVVKQLLEDKLGIQPVIVKAGDKKDWPSSFQPPTDEQLQYLQTRLIDPAYKRFVEIIAENRKMLTTEDVNRLADGSIYWAEKALEEKLIDEIGYQDDAIEKVKSLAGIDKAQVVEYRRVVTLSEILSAESRTSLKLDRRTLYELALPQVLYLWPGPQ